MKSTTIGTPRENGGVSFSLVDWTVDVLIVVNSTGQQMIPGIEKWTSLTTATTVGDKILGTRVGSFSQ